MRSFTLWTCAAAVLTGCAGLPRPAVLDDATSAITSPEAQELESLRPKLYGEAKDNLAKAEAAYADGEPELTQQYAELALQKVRAAENFVARDSAIAQAEALRERYEALASRAESERKDVERLTALDARVEALTAKLGAKGQNDAAVRNAKKAMLEARGRQAEAIGASAPQFAKAEYDQGVALLESGVSALELGLLEDSISSSAAASAKFEEAIGRSGVAKTAAGKASPDAGPKAEADAALLEAQAAQAAAIGSGARASDPAKFGEGETLLATAERRFQSAQYPSAKELAEKATRAFRSVSSAAIASATGTGTRLDISGGTQPGPSVDMWGRPGPSASGPSGERASAGSATRAQRLIQQAEDVRADAIARGMQETDVEMAHSGYLLDTARRALRDGDELRAEEKARESRQILRDALSGRFGAAVAGADKGEKQENALRSKADAALDAARSARVAQSVKDADCKGLKDGDGMLNLGEKRFQSGDFAGALESAIRATERIGSCAAIARDTIASGEPGAKPGAEGAGSADAKLKAASALSQARTAVAIAKADRSPSSTEGEALLETADNWYDRKEYALAEKFATQATDAVKKGPGAAPSVAASKPVTGATRATALKALVKAQRDRADGMGAGPDTLKKVDRMLASAQTWFDDAAYPEAQAFAEDASKALATKTATKPSSAAAAATDTMIATKGPGDRRSAEDAIAEALAVRREADDRVTAPMQGTLSRGEMFLREAKDALSDGSYAQARSMARAAAAQFDAVRAAAKGGAEAPRPGVARTPTDARPVASGGGTVSRPADRPSDRPSDRPADRPYDRPTDAPYDRPNDRPSDRPSDRPAAQREVIRTTVEEYTEEKIVRYQRQPDAIPTGWEEPYRHVIRALKLRDGAPAQTDPADKEAFARGSELLQQARTAWAAKQHASAAELADRAAEEFVKLGATETGGNAPEVIGPDGVSTPTGPTPKKPGSGTDSDAYRSADAAVREARVMLEVCEREKCSERSAKDAVEGKEMVASAQAALADGRHAYAEELADNARKKLAAALTFPRGSQAAPADTAKTKQEKDAASDALREADVKRKLCEQAKCGDRDLEAWLRAESNLGAARAAFADGDYVRAEAKAKDADTQLKASLDAAKTAPPKVESGLTMPAGMRGVEVKDGRIVVTPPVDFKSGSATLTDESAPSIETIAIVILHNKDKISNVNLVGFTDSRGNAAINKNVSKRRAQAVADALVKAGVPRAILKSEGRGADEPIADNETPEGRAQNRRVEVRVVAK